MPRPEGDGPPSWPPKKGFDLTKKRNEQTQARSADSSGDEDSAVSTNADIGVGKKGPAPALTRSPGGRVISASWPGGAGGQGREQVRPATSHPEVQGQSGGAARPDARSAGSQGRGSRARRPGEAPPLERGRRVEEAQARPAPRTQEQAQPQASTGGVPAVLRRGAAGPLAGTRGVTKGFGNPAAGGASHFDAPGLPAGFAEMISGLPDWLQSTAVARARAKGWEFGSPIAGAAPWQFESPLAGAAPLFYSADLVTLAAGGASWYGSQTAAEERRAAEKVLRQQQKAGARAQVAQVSQAVVDAAGAEAAAALALPRIRPGNTRTFGEVAEAGGLEIFKATARTRAGQQARYGDTASGRAQAAPALEVGEAAHAEEAEILARQVPKQPGVGGRNSADAPALGGGRVRIREDGTEVLVEEGRVQAQARGQGGTGAAGAQGQARPGEPGTQVFGAGAPPPDNPPTSEASAEEPRDEPRLILHRGPRPRLTQEQVRVLMEHMQSGHTVAELIGDTRFVSADELGNARWQLAIEDSNENIEDFLVACFTGDLLNQIKRYKTNPLTYGMKLMDLYVAGQLGFRDAIRTFEPDHPSEREAGEVPLMGYASFKIRHHVRTAIAQVLDISHYQLARYNIAVQVLYAFYGEFRGQDLTEAEFEQQLLYHTRFSENAIQWIIDFQDTHSLLSLNRAVGEGATEHGDQMEADVSVEVADQDELSIQRAALLAAFRHLDPDARAMILDDTGNNESGTALTPAEMAVKYKISEAEVAVRLERSYELLRGVDELAPFARGRGEEVSQRQHPEQATLTLLSKTDREFVESVLAKPATTKTQQIQRLSPYLTAEQLARRLEMHRRHVMRAQRLLVTRGDLSADDIKRDTTPLNAADEALVELILTEPIMRKTEQIRQLSHYLTAEELAQNLGMHKTHIKDDQRRLVARGDLTEGSIRQETSLSRTEKDFVRRVLAATTKQDQIRRLAPYLRLKELVERVGMDKSDVSKTRKLLVARGDLSADDIKRDTTPLNAADEALVESILAVPVMKITEQIRQLSSYLTAEQLAQSLKMRKEHVTEAQRLLVGRGDLSEEDIKQDPPLGRLEQEFVQRILVATTREDQVRRLSPHLPLSELVRRLKMDKAHVWKIQRRLVERGELRDVDIRSGRTAAWAGKEDDIIQLVGMGGSYQAIGAEVGLSKGLVQQAVMHLREIGRIQTINRPRAERIVGGRRPTEVIEKVGRRLERDQKVTHWQEAVLIWEEAHGPTGLLSETERA